MAKDDIKITISREGGINKFTQEGQEKLKEQNTGQVGGDTKPTQSVGGVIAAQMGKKALQFATSNYGNLTGDYVMQEKISSVIELGGLVAMASQGPVGIAAAVGSVAIQGINYAIDIKKKNQQSAFIRERVGTITKSGGRL